MPRFRIDSAPIPTRRFRLPEGERSTAFALPELYTHVKPPVWGAGVTKAQTPKRTSRRPVEPKRPVEAQTPKRTTTQQAFETFAPDMDTKPLARVTLAVASEEPMPGLFGDMIFACAPQAHDMRRLSLGTMSLLREHNGDDPVGRVLSLQHVQARTGGWAIFGEGEIADIPLGRSTLAEVTAGARLGVSPAFLMKEFDVNDDFDMEITASEIYECSLVTAPRGRSARVLGTNMEASMMGMSMNGNMDGVGDVVNPADVIGMSLVAGRKALASGQGSHEQQDQLREFFRLFDAGLENGLSRDKAARAAKALVGL